MAVPRVFHIKPRVLLQVDHQWVGFPPMPSSGDRGGRNQGRPGIRPQLHGEVPVLHTVCQGGHGVQRVREGCKEGALGVLECLDTFLSFGGFEQEWMGPRP